VLLGQRAFYPYQPPPAPGLERAIEKMLAASAHQGFELKVAIIDSRIDLGAVPNFFGHPQPYAEFLDREISFNRPQPLLVVMAAGFGIVHAGPRRALAHTAIDAREGSDGLIRTAMLAAAALARSQHVRLAVPTVSRGGGGSRAGTPALLWFGAPILLLAIAGLATARGPRRAWQSRRRARRAQDARSRPARRATRAQIRRRQATVLLLLGALALLAVELHGGHARSGTATESALPPHGRRAAAPHARTGGHRQQGSQESTEVRKLVALGKPIYCAGRTGNEVALTFDDGPGPYTRLVLAKLRKHHIAATFFDVGRNIPLLPHAPREERAIGAVGDHTFTHPLLTAISPREAEAQIVRAQSALTSASGGPVFLFRPPYGGHDSAVDATVRAHGMLEVLWSVDSQDSLGANYAKIERNVISGMHPGAIILMHENHGQTVRALLNIFADLERKHLRAVSLPQLLTDDPPSVAAVSRGGDCLLSRGGALSGS
jgi:peptidoglycan/xylan/chitin deacetylase (PgdA/CDA1 family)